MVNNGGASVSVIGKLPETAVQSLPSGLLQLSLNAISSNTLVMTFNGVEYTESAGSGNVFGAWSLSGFAEDSNGYYEGSSTPISIGNTILLSNSLTIDPAPAAASLTPSNAILYIGQHETYNVILSGGTGTFTANLIYVSGPSGATVNSITAGNVIQSLTGQSAGTVTFSSFNSFSTNGIYTFNVVATDTGTSTPFVFNSISNTITVSNTPTGTTTTPATDTLDIGQNVIISTTLSGGFGPFTANLVYSNNGVVANTITGISSGGTANLNFVSSYVGSFTFNVVVTDTGTPTPYIFNAPGSSVITVSQPTTTTISSGGGGGPPITYNISISDNVNSFSHSNVPVLTVYITSGTSVSSQSSYNQDQLPAFVSHNGNRQAQLNFACSFVLSNGTEYTYDHFIFGLGYNYACNQNATVYGVGNFTAYYRVTGRNAITTTVTTTTVTTTTVTTTTVPSSIIATSNATVSVSRTQSQSLNFIHYNIQIMVYSNFSSSRNVTVHVSNSTSTAPNAPANYTIINAYNITARNTTLTVTVHYPCSLPSGRIAQYIYLNGAWTKITPFTVNAAACTVMFSMPGDHVVGVFEAPSPATTLPTTVAPTTVATTTIPYAPHQSSIYIYAAIIIVIIIIALGVAYALSRPRRRR